MQNVSFSKSELSSYYGVDLSDKHKHRVWSFAYIKQNIHERKIDEFFRTDVNAPHKRTSIQAIVGACSGVIIPTLFFAKRQNPNIKFNTIKNIIKATDINYGLKEVITISSFGVLGGLAGGLIDKKERNKLDKIEESTFQLTNVALTSSLVNLGMKLSNNVKFLNNPVGKILSSVLGITIGASSAVAISNKLDDKFFDKYNHDPERKLKKKDFIVHIDDFLGALVLAKVPFADKLHINKFLPLIYMWSGYNVGDC